MKSNKNWKAYITSDSDIPQRIQNMIIREYFEKNDIPFSLSATELNNSNEIILKSISDNSHNYDSIVFYSTSTLNGNIENTINIFSNILKNKCSIHFAYDDLSISNNDDINKMEELLTINKLSVDSPLRGGEVNIITKLHKSTKRDYLKRVVEEDKIECSKVASKFSEEYWDGERKYGYGGYKYDGRWKPVAEQFIKQYQLTNNSSVLDIGCGKGFLLLELKKILPDITVRGIDISEYAIEYSHPEIKEFLRPGDAKALPYNNNEFDLVISHATLHNLPLPDLNKALKEIERVKIKSSWICVESYRNIEEKVNLMYWQLTCESLMSKESWLWMFENTGYTGDYEFMYFE